MTEHSEAEMGVFLSLLKRLVDQHLPQLLDMQERVERGEKLSDRDVAFLEQALNDAILNRQHVVHFPEYKDIVAKLIHMYDEITRKALENEQARK